jgi:uncharacterized protein DUF4386
MTDDLGEARITARIARGSQSSYARFAGLMYFFTVFDVTGVVIISRLTGSGSFLDTAHRIAASETLYRIGLLCGLLGTMSTVLLAIGLYVTLKPVDRNLATTALLFRLAESVIGGVAIMFSFANLQIYLEANHASAFDAGQLGALADVVSRTSAVGINISVIFFSVGSTIFFYLFLKSAYIPRSLAVWGLLGSLFCMAAFVGNLLLHQSSDALLGIGGLPVGIAEPVLGLWLLIRGINTDPNASQAQGRA